MELKREIDRLPHPHRNYHAGDARPHLLRFLSGNIGEDDRHPGKHLVAVLEREFKHLISSCNHKVQLYPAVPAAESLGQALPITFLVESRVFDGRGIEVDLPRNASAHRRFHQGPGLWKTGPVMQHEYVLHSRLRRAGWTGQDAQQKTKSYKPRICRGSDAAVP